MVKTIADIIYCYMTDIVILLIVLVCMILLLCGNDGAIKKILETTVVAYLGRKSTILDINKKR